MQELISECKRATESAMLQVLKESSSQVYQAFQIVKNIRDGWPEALRGIKISQLARERLNDQVNFLHQLAERGLTMPLLVCHIHVVSQAFADQGYIFTEIEMLSNIRTAFESV